MNYCGFCLFRGAYAEKICQLCNRTGGLNAVWGVKCCVEAYAEDAQAPASSFGSEKEGSQLARRNSLPAGTASHTEDQPVTS